MSKIKFTAEVPQAPEPLTFTCDHAVLVAINEEENKKVVELWWHKPDGTNLLLAVQIIAENLANNESPQMKMLGQIIGTSLQSGVEKLQGLMKQENN
jgi:hypothetical protein